MMATDATKTVTNLLRPRLSGILARLPMQTPEQPAGGGAADPLGNVLPAVAISLMAFGVLACDGAWVLAGIGVAGAVVFVVSGVIFAMLKAGMHFLAQALP